MVFFGKKLYRSLITITQILFFSPQWIPLLIWLQKNKKFLIIADLERHGQNISNFVTFIEPELRKQKLLRGKLTEVIILMSADCDNAYLQMRYSREVAFVTKKTSKGYPILKIASLFYGNKVSPSAQIIRFPICSSLTRFTNVECSTGRAFLSAHERTFSRSFLCYAVRNRIYYENWNKVYSKQIKINLNRDPSEATYLDAFANYSKDGMSVVRMGKFLEPVAPKIRSDTFFDYASEFRSDFLDVFLIFRCKFFVNGATGLFSIAQALNKRVAHCDLYDIRMLCAQNDLQIFQRLWLHEESRYATISEMLRIHNYSKDTVQSRINIELVKNTSLEIANVVDEMNARIDGTWVETKEDIELQRRYQELIVKYSDKPEWNGGGRIGAQFLRDNQDLLR